MFSKYRTVLIYAVLSLMLMVPAAVLAAPQQLTVGAGCGEVSDELTIPVTVDDPESLAGAAFTLEYPSDLDVRVDTQFFEVIQSHKISSGLMVAAASANGASAADSKTIMTLRVSLASGAADGSYPISIAPSEISNASAGYDTAKRIDLLTSGEASPGTLISPADYDAGGAVVGGEVTFCDPEKDSDQDGYSDLDECRNGTDPDDPGDPGDSAHDGYDPCTDAQVEKQVVKLSPDSAEVKVEETFNITVDYIDDSQTGGIDLLVHYDGSLVTYADGTENPIRLSFDAANSRELSFAAQQTGSADFEVERAETSATSDIPFCSFDTTVTVRPDCIDLDVEDFSASPNTDIESGEPVTISWDVKNADSVSIREGKMVSTTIVSNGSPKGQTTVYPSQSTYYILEATAVDQCAPAVAEEYVSVTSTCSSPNISFSAEPKSISQGGSATLSWRISNAVSAQIIGLGSVSSSGGSKSVKPTQTTRYTLTAESSCGATSSKAVTVYVSDGTCGTPEISDFSSKQEKPGQVVLSWETTGADSVNIIINRTYKLDAGLPPNGTIKHSITEKTEYQLIAVNSCGNRAEKYIVVEPGAGGSNDNVPGIKEFLANGEKTTNIVYGERVKLSWEVNNANRVEIDNGVGEVDPESGFVWVTPKEETTRYRLTAHNQNGDAVNGVTIHLSYQEVPGIKEFLANGKETIDISYGERVKLSWEVRRATRVEIDNGVGEVDPESGFVWVTPTEETTRYRLTAYNPYDSAVNAVTVRMSYKAVPGIKDFSANKQEIDYGGRVKLSWEVKRATRVEIDNGVGEVDPESGFVWVTPTEETMRYRLTAHNSWGYAVNAVTINAICNPPGITDFSTDSHSIRYGESATLYWEVIGAERVEIDNGVGQVDDPESGSAEVSPEQTTTYLLTATKACGSVAVNAVKVSVTGSKDNLPPEPPALESPGDKELNVPVSPVLETSSFSDEDGDDHVKTRWQIAEGEPIFDDQYMVYDEITHQYLTRIIVPTDMILEPNTAYYWRAMHYDGSLWSPASEVHSFVTTAEGPEYENGIRIENIVKNDRDIPLGVDFVDGSGNPVNEENIKVLKYQAVNEALIGIKAPEGTLVQKCGVVDPAQYASGQASSSMEFLYGLIEFALDLPNRGDEVSIELHFSEPIPENVSWFTFDPNRGEYYDYQQSVEQDVVLFSEDRMSVTLKFKDGGYGDLIDEPDGRIIDPGGLSAAVSNGGDSGSGGGGSSGCFIRALLGR
ncbi:MAG: choice-of-anchor U domain-containing protein [Desulfobacterales bacterium]|nr:choice-of-anchor U domain-containing protein [Desulfobacterales bacterium]